MKYTFETDDDLEAARIISAEKMANVIWQFAMNGKSQFKYREDVVDYEEVFAYFHELLDNEGINIENLTE